MDFNELGNTGAAEGSSNLTFNLDEVDESKAGFQAMPKGDYECVIEDADFGPSQKGSPMITFKYKVVDGEFANRLLFHHCVLDKDFGVALLKKIIVSSGAQVNFSSFNPQEFADNGDAIGLPLLVKVGIQTYQGEKRNNVKGVDVSKAGGGSFMD